MNNDTAYHLALIKLAAKKKWLKKAESLMRKHYCISFSDAGVTPEEFWVRWGNEAQDGTTPKEAVMTFGLKYNLTDQEV